MDIVSTVVAALIGAVLGSLGGEWLRYRFQRRFESERTRRDVAQKHLIQLQDAMESLYFRLTNVAELSGKAVMTRPYYELSSVYAIGNLLAHKRRLMLDGIYALLDVYGAGFPNQLESSLEAIESMVGNEWTSSVSFYRYERLALAETLLQWDSGWRVSTYAEFTQQEKTGDIDMVVEPARQFVKRLQPPHISQLRRLLEDALVLVSANTRIATAFGRIQTP